MKQYLLILLTILIVGCNQQDNIKVKKRMFIVAIISSDGWSNGYVACDSFQMINTKKAFIYVDGTKINIESTDLIIPSTNN